MSIFWVLVFIMSALAISCGVGILNLFVLLAILRELGNLSYKGSILTTTRSDER